MNTSSVEVRAGNDSLGGGFFILSDIVATARHCLVDVQPEEEITVKTIDHEIFEASILAVVEDKDLALLRISLPETDVVSRAPTVALPYLEAPWRSPYIPSFNQISIRGKIVHLHDRFACAYGGELRASQLEAKPPLDSYSGYSGGVIELRETVAASVGMILQEARTAGSRDTLYAADMREFVENFNLLSDIRIVDTVLEDELSAIGAGVAKDIKDRLVLNGRADGVLPGRIETLVIDTLRREIEGGGDV